MVKSKARISFEQYIPSKPVKWGFKVYAACGATTGILCNTEEYTGQEQADGEGLTHAVVNWLSEDLDNQGCVIYTDNYYTLPTLATTLLNHGIHLVGTPCTNRPDFPATVKHDMKTFENQAE